jgi:ribosome-dependent ATPase
MGRLRVDEVSVSYKKRVALHPVAFEADSGEIIGFIGADGAGKSSLMHAVAGVIRFKGTVTYDGHAYRSPAEAEPIKQTLGFMPQGLGLILYETLTVGEHLDFFADLRSLHKDAAFRDYKAQLLHMAGLADFVDRRAGNLSGGMMQKLALICTLVHRPKLLLLDEPTTGVDPLSRMELWEILKQVAAEGTLCIVSTAYMAEAEKMDRILLFDEGDLIASGTAAELLESVASYVYAPSDTPIENAITLKEATYSLAPLGLPRQKPTLDALFFVNRLKKEGAAEPLLALDGGEGRKLPDVIMQSRGLTKRFDGFTADDAIDMTLRQGEILGLLGANGAGKTTFIKMLLGLLPIDEGELTLLGKAIHSAEDRRELKSQLGYVSQHFALYDDLSVRENLLYFAGMHRIDSGEALKRIDRYAETLGFEPYLDSMPPDLPIGIKQRFSVAAALLHEPAVLFLDEPTSGVDAVARAVFWDLLRQLKTQWGISILITTHYMSEAEYCDRVVLLKDGKKVADDTVEDLYKSHPSAKDFEAVFLAYYREETSA